MGYTGLLWYLWVLRMTTRVCMGDGELLTSVNSSSSTTSPSCGPSMQCANLGNISYPFWDSASCAASPSYVLSNCSSPYSTVAHWDALSLALQTATTGDSPRPALITGLALDLHAGQGDGSINLTWDASLPTMDICESLFSTHNLSQYNIPASINLTGFAKANDKIQLYFPLDTPRNTYLFFNCTNPTAMQQFVNSSSNEDNLWEDNLWQKEGEVCDRHKDTCANRLSATSCISLTLSGGTVFMLKHIMDTLACSYFTFGIQRYDAYHRPDPAPITSIRPGLVQLSWRVLSCTWCERVIGFCVYNEWGDPNCKHDASDALYQRLVQISLFLAVILVPVISVSLCFCYFGKIKKGLRGLSSRLARLTISVLKKVLRRLQQSTYRPNLSIILRELEGLTERPVEYSYSSISSATKSFSHVVGEGGFGVVYKGTLPESGSTDSEGRGMQIAVKVLEMRSRHMKKQFLNEVGTIGRIHHVNVVRLLGFCIQEDHEMLVYEYVANGSLDRWLFAGNDGEIDVERMLDWSQRYAIALGVAKGLSYLHEECRHRTVHCDIKPQNILLDNAMSPKIADFGLSRLMGRDESQVVTLARGTPGYMAPEFWMGGESRLSTKFDVYSYGMVLLELISGRRNFAYDDAMGSICCFPAVAFEAAMEGNVAAILDGRLGSTMQASTHEDTDEAQWNQIWTIAFVALWCIQDHPASRPSMSEVVQYLEGIIAIPRNPPQPSISTTPALAPFPITSNYQQVLTPISVGR